MFPTMEKEVRTLTSSPKRLTHKQLASLVAGPLVLLVEQGSSCAKVMCRISQRGNAAEQFAYKALEALLSAHMPFLFLGEGGGG